ncbi:YwiC-like protein [Anoxybacillus vitaminiphilus]|uniref:YwiC-like protein n=1 Tax=Paranoxybacillus vitaminiphilus TaxID=581036 RepID=A0A327YAJ4_9BACL|nr:YwiC-like family protein [Anoxybacillus vitaminiphilus]RAK17016.1 YwiC-like protein [Anoxybacillus vitaminiphilus]
MKPLIPKQHGAWAMLVIPFALGAYAGGVSWLHIPLFFGWLFLYLATYPMLMAVKNKRKEYFFKWAVTYFLLAIVLLIIPLIYDFTLIYFGFAMLPFFFINLYYAKKKNDRALLNDMAAIAAFGVGGLASFYIGQGRLNMTAWEIYMFCFLFFIGSTFYVKTMIREKKNAIYKWTSWGYHLLLIIGLVIVGYPLLAIAYAPSVIRALYLYGKSLSVMKVGVLEIVNSAYFLLVMFFLL